MEERKERGFLPLEFLYEYLAPWQGRGVGRTGSNRPFSIVSLLEFVRYEREI